MLSGGADLELQALQGIPRVESGRSWKGSEKTFSRASSGRSQGNAMPFPVPRVGSERDIPQGLAASPEVLGVKKVSFNLKNTTVRATSNEDLDYSTSLGSLIAEKLGESPPRVFPALDPSPVQQPRLSPQTAPSAAPAGLPAVDVKQAVALLSLCDAGAVALLPDHDFVDKICRALGLPPCSAEQGVEFLENVVRAAAQEEAVAGSRGTTPDNLSLPHSEGPFAGPGDDGAGDMWGYGAVDAPVFQPMAAPYRQQDSAHLSTPFAGHRHSTGSVQSTTMVSPSASVLLGASDSNRSSQHDSGSAAGAAGATPAPWARSGRGPRQPIGVRRVGSRQLGSPGSTQAGSATINSPTQQLPKSLFFTGAQGSPARPRDATRRGLVVGASYQDSSFRLDHNLVEAAVQQAEWMLGQQGVQTTVLLESSAPDAPQPTKRAICDELKVMAAEAAPGDELYLFFVGRPEKYLSRSGFAPVGLNAAQADAHLSGAELLSFLRGVREGVSWIVVSDLTPPAVCVEGLPWAAALDPATGKVRNTATTGGTTTGGTTTRHVSLTSSGVRTNSSQERLRSALKQPATPRRIAGNRPRASTLPRIVSPTAEAAKTVIIRSAAHPVTTSDLETSSGSPTLVSSGTPPSAPLTGLSATMKIPKGGFPVSVLRNEASSGSSSSSPPDKGNSDEPEAVFGRKISRESATLSDGGTRRVFSSSVSSNTELMKTLPLEYIERRSQASSSPGAAHIGAPKTDGAVAITVIAARGFGYAVTDQRVLNYTGAIVLALVKAGMAPAAHPPCVADAIKFIQSELDGVAAYCGDGKAPKAVLSASDHVDLQKPLLPRALPTEGAGEDGDVAPPSPMSVQTLSPQTPSVPIPWIASPVLSVRHSSPATSPKLRAGRSAPYGLIGPPALPESPQAEGTWPPHDVVPLPPPETDGGQGADPPVHAYPPPRHRPPVYAHAESPARMPPMAPPARMPLRTPDPTAVPRKRQFWTLKEEHFAPEEDLAVASEIAPAVRSPPRNPVPRCAPAATTKAAAAAPHQRKRAFW
eukprot:TRINITY_DN18487_c0_g1_i1.p1 TRINITY_DN18487_c0_g1~~TRINITY_DN18487_c0_g1_i1.p1  ORF type:complete len:1037 (+),score=206.44 TRINITY_DN18487_c0_g1_i1:153-3263(+)